MSGMALEANLRHCAPSRVPCERLPQMERAVEVQLEDHGVHCDCDVLPQPLAQAVRRCGRPVNAAQQLTDLAQVGLKVDIAASAASTRV